MTDHLDPCICESFARATERASLLHKNEQVRARVEAMIGRLRTMEQGA